MYLAEIRGKLSKENENREDILTSNVFSFFKYASREHFLLPFLLSLRLEVSSYDAHEAEFIFWPSYSDRTEPDLVILVGRYYLLFEAKLYSSFSPETAQKKHQLVREIEGGAMEAESLGKEFRIIAVTADYSHPNSFQDVPSEYKDQLIWINWQRIALLIFNILERHPNISSETRLFAEDLYSLLLNKNLRNFEGTSTLSQCLELSDHPSMIFFEAKTATFRGDFLGFMPALEGITGMMCVRDRLFYTSKRCQFQWTKLGEGILNPSERNLFFTGSELHGKKRTDHPDETGI
jgi:hypothetical protein